MPKRSSDKKPLSKAKRTKLETEDQTSKKYITTKTNELINNITSLDPNHLTKVIKIYDLFLPHLSNEQKFNEYEGNIRLLNLQIFKIFEKLFDLEDLKSNMNLRNVYEMYKLNLSFFLENIPYDCSLIIDNLEILMKLLKLESVDFATFNKDTKAANPYFPSRSYRSLLISLLKSNNGEILNDGTNSNIVIEEFVNSYFRKYKDLQFYFFNDLDLETLNELDLDIEDIFSKFLTIARQPLNVLDDEYTKTFVKNLPSSCSNEKQFQLAFEARWLHFLSKELSASQHKTTLLILHKRIIPSMRKPTNLMDFLTDTYNIGGIMSILALNGLFELMRKYNLDYPNFYTKLYSLFDDSLLHVKYRSRFFRLSDLFLASTHLPAVIVASFIKRMARLSVNSSPSAVVTVIPFIYNLLKRHPTCMVLLQNDTADKFTDPFNNLEEDPMKTNAMESSLWELETLQSHYHPNVATLAKIFSQPFKKPSYNMEDFLDWSYDSLLESEGHRRMRDDVALEYESFETVLGDYIKNWGW